LNEKVKLSLRDGLHGIQALPELRMGYKIKSYASLEMERIQSQERKNDNLNFAPFPEDVEGYDLMEKVRSYPSKSSGKDARLRLSEYFLSWDSRFDWIRSIPSETTIVYVAFTEHRNLLWKDRT
jgi:hypothetical protein